MMPRTPPSSGATIYNEPIPVFAFEKNEGAISSTFNCRIIHRVPIQLALQSGDTIASVRYGRRYWPIYKAETFASKSLNWVKAGDTLYGPECTDLELPLKYAYLFDCDTPRGFYA